MKKYFITSDSHGFYTILINELHKNGFDENNNDHILIFCGDLFDRGDESKEIYNFIKSIPIQRRILIRGNHEYLFIDLMHKKMPDDYDESNGTVKTFNDLTDYKYDYFFEWQNLVSDKKLKNIEKWFMSDEWTDYYETNNYIFTHAFIPLKIDDKSYFKHMYRVETEYLSYKEDWRNSSQKEFENATWGCPWKLALAGLNQTKKYIVCGHWHTADFFNYMMRLKKRYNLYEDNPIFISKKYKLIGLDACTAVTKKINVLVLNEDEL